MKIYDVEILNGVLRNFGNREIKTLTIRNDNKRRAEEYKKVLNKSNFIKDIIDNGLLFIMIYRLFQTTFL